jgi:hypothetical protein
VSALGTPDARPLRSKRTGLGLEFTTPILLLLILFMLGRVRRLGVPGGAVLRRAGGRGRPVCPVLGGEDGALARRPQAPLEVVEKFLTR